MVGRLVPPGVGARMKAAGKPFDEEQRLRSLASHCILDTPPEAGFDALTRLAAKVFDMPIALVSITDAHRQWFKSSHGLGDTEGERETSFCGHVTTTGEPLVVNDACLDERFADNPAVLGEPLVRFYAGIPMRTSEGHVLGSFCVVDRRPRELTAEQLELLTLLAGQASDQLAARRQKAQLEAEHAALVKSEAGLRERKARLHALFEGLSEGVALLDRGGTVRECNAAAEAILGLGRSQLEGRTPFDPRWMATHPDGTPFPGDEHPPMVALRTGRRSVDVPMRISKPDGTRASIRINAEPIGLGPDGLPDSVVTTFRDVTQEEATTAERELLRDRLARQERLAATGQLAAGVGHEINNPLAYMNANLDFALDEVRSLAGAAPSPRMDQLVEALTDAQGGAFRIGKIVSGLRSLTGKQGARAAVEVRAALEASVSMAMYETRGRALLEMRLAPVPAVIADEAALAQVFLSLIVNASRAFESPDPLRNRIVVGLATSADGSVEVTVEDNGPGIPAELLPRIFDPFFTAKDVGGRTGLGLSISHNLVSALGGEISCQSGLGNGTKFRVVLPAAAQERASEGRAAGSERGRAGSSQTAT